VRSKSKTIESILFDAVKSVWGAEGLPQTLAVFHVAGEVADP